MRNALMDYIARVCPECGEQEVSFSPDTHSRTFCLNHEKEGRTTRPEHVVVRVIPPAEIIQARRAWEASHGR